MGAYSFKQRFVPMVEDGSKTHTIRGKRRYPDRPGSTFHGFYGMRTKQCRKIMQAPIPRVEDIVIEPKIRLIWIAETRLTDDEADLFAWRDGFRPDDIYAWPPETVVSPLELMMRFWRLTHGERYFTGDVIHWDYSRREVPRGA